MESGGRSTWLLLSDGGVIFRFFADTGEWSSVATIGLIGEPDHKPWCGHALNRRLHLSRDSQFAAVVNDFGRHGQLIDLKSGKVTLELNGGEYYSDTVPFSFSFFELNGKTFAIHRTAWNRLEISDPTTGSLLTERTPNMMSQGGRERPEHDLDFFHGALYPSPDGLHVVDDGWVWHPVGVMAYWSLARWLSENVWESEDGPTKKHLCARDYYWNKAVAWIDENRIAVGGIGDDDIDMIEGARIFDISLPTETGGRYRGKKAIETNSFAGPAGVFFSNGISLFSSDQDGLSRWNLNDGACTGKIDGFRPSHQHRSARELAQLVNGVLKRWIIEPI